MRIREKVRVYVDTDKPMSQWNPHAHHHEWDHVGIRFVDVLPKLASLRRGFPREEQGLPYKKCRRDTPNDLTVIIVIGKDDPQNPFVQDSTRDKGRQRGSQGATPETPDGSVDAPFQAGVDEQIPFASPKIGRTCGGQQRIVHEGLTLKARHEAGGELQAVTKGGQV